MIDPDDVATLEMSQAEYARHRGVSRQAIGQLVASGRIPVIEKEKRCGRPAASYRMSVVINR